MEEGRQYGHPVPVMLTEGERPREEALPQEALAAVGELAKQCGGASSGESLASGTRERSPSCTAQLKRIFLPLLQMLLLKGKAEQAGGKYYVAICEWLLWSQILVSTSLLEVQSVLSADPKTAALFKAWFETTGKKSEMLWGQLCSVWLPQIKTSPSNTLDNKNFPIIFNSDKDPDIGVQFGTQEWSELIRLMRFMISSGRLGPEAENLMLFVKERFVELQGQLFTPLEDLPVPMLDEQQLETAQLLWKVLLRLREAAEEERKALWNVFEVASKTNLLCLDQKKKQLLFVVRRLSNQPADIQMGEPLSLAGCEILLLAQRTAYEQLQLFYPSARLQKICNGGWPTVSRAFSAILRVDLQAQKKEDALVLAHKGRLATLWEQACKLVIQHYSFGERWLGAVSNFLDPTPTDRESCRAELRVVEEWFHAYRDASDPGKQGHAVRRLLTSTFTCSFTLRKLINLCSSIDNCQRWSIVELAAADKAITELEKEWSTLRVQLAEGAQEDQEKGSHKELVSRIKHKITGMDEKVWDEAREAVERLASVDEAPADGQWYFVVECLAACLCVQWWRHFVHPGHAGYKGFLSGKLLPKMGKFVPKARAGPEEPLKPAELEGYIKALFTGDEQAKWLRELDYYSQRVGCIQQQCCYVDSQGIDWGGREGLFQSTMQRCLLIALATWGEVQRRCAAGECAELFSDAPVVVVGTPFRGRRAKPSGEANAFAIQDVSVIFPGKWLHVMSADGFPDMGLLREIEEWEGRLHDAAEAVAKAKKKAKEAAAAAQKQ